MCSYEYRIRAVELFIKLGKRVRPTICQLYFPVKNSLKGWFREYEERLHLRWAMHAGAQVKAKKTAVIEHYPPTVDASLPL